MTTFTIDSDDHIERITGNRKPDAGDHFTSLDELGQLTEPWPVPRLVRIWNSLPGATAVKRFTDRKTAVSRIWKALQKRRWQRGGEEQNTTQEQRSVEQT